VANDFEDLSGDARVCDVIIVVREDEAQHRDVNHEFADQLARRPT
jgi:ubiquinol oxidase